MVCALSTALSDTDCFNVLNAASLDIVLPCYNPDPDWEKAVIHSFKAICNALQDVAIRLLIVNDGSVLYAGKEAPEAISRAIPFFQWISYYPNKGKGAALREGMRHSDADITIYTDIDFPYQEASLVEIFEQLRHGKADVVAGVKDAGYYNGVPIGRRIISRLLRGMTAVFLGIRITDTQCGLKGMNAKGRAVFLQTTIDRYLFDLEFIYLASHTRDLQLRSHAIRLKESTRFTRMNAGILLQESLNFVRIILRRFAT
jgi:glycosyltransferase involved in cell wall biosynthesis